jgi:hypothetical protein
MMPSPIVVAAQEPKLSSGEAEQRDPCRQRPWQPHADAGAVWERGGVGEGLAARVLAPTEAPQSGATWGQSKPSGDL